MSEVKELTNTEGAGTIGAVNVMPDGWTAVKFNNHLDVRSGKGFSMGEYSENGLRLVRIDNVSWGKITWDSIAFLPLNYRDEYPELVLQEGDILLALNRPITQGKLKIARLSKQDTPSILYQRVGKILFKDNSVRYEFAYHWLSYWLFEFLIKSLVGSDQPFINISELKKVQMQLPPLPEQQKIAQILTSVDEVIEKTQAQIDKLKDLKTAMMQELLTKGIGHIEFKDSLVGRIPVGWEAETLKELTIQIRDGNYGADYPKASEMLESGIPFLTSTVVGNDQKINVKKLKYISDEKHGLLAKAHIKKDDVLFTNRGASVGNVAMVPEILDDSNIGPQLTFLRVDPTKMLPLFLYIALQSDYFKKQLRQLDSGSAMNFFGIGTTEKFIFALPSLNEQEKLADAINSLFIRIDTLNIKLKQTSLIKKALMQDLLTGKVRVNTEQSNPTLAVG
jgi:type I restriction enzyme S subunit